MNLLSYAIPFFILALLGELALDRWRGTGYYRLNDSVASLSTGALNTTFGLFTKLFEVAIYGFVLHHFSINTLDPALFDFSARGLALWIGALLLWDFCYYWHHRIGHEVSVFWAAHAVHHQSEDYNLSTALRQTSTGFLLGWLFYLPMFVLGIPVEVFATVAAIDLIYQFWVHTQHVRRLGWADYVFVTPSNHRVHHAQNDIYIDRNYGGILILWDRIFGTFQDELPGEPPVFGIRKALHSWNPFVANFQVYRMLFVDALRAERWRDKLSIWFRRTGWRPEDVRRRHPYPPDDLGHFRKFDAAASPALRRYLVGQFAVAVVATAVLSLAFLAIGAGASLWFCGALWLLLLNLGTLNEGRRRAIRNEWLRVVLVNPALIAGGFAALGQWPPTGPIVASLCGYTLATAVWLALASRRDAHVQMGEGSEAIPASGPHA